MIEDGKKRKFDLVVAKEVSRFSRDTIDSLFYTRKLLEYDVCVYFLSDNIVTASNDGELRLTIMSSMAQDEVRKISERTKFGFKRALEKGTVLGTDNIWGYKKDKGKLVIDEDEACLVRTVFNIYANDSKIGLKKLSTILNQQGYYNRNGNPIHQNTLKNIIRNPKYKGYYTGGLSTVVDYRSKKRNFNDPTGWKVYKDYEKVPPIVSEELWEKANKKLLSRSKSSVMYRKHQEKYPLSGKVYCEKHKCGFVRRVRHYKNREDVIYWYCGNFHRTGKKDCVPACFKQQDIYDTLISVLKKYKIDKEETCDELLSFYMQFSKVKGEQEREEKLQKELYKLQIKTDKLLDLVLDGFLTKEELSRKKRSIEIQMEQIQTQITLIESKKRSKEQEKYNVVLKENILKELEINKDNLENYIEEMIEKIVIIEDVNNESKEYKNKLEIEMKYIGDNKIYTRYVRKLE